MDVHVTVEGQRMSFHDSGYRFAPQSQKFIKFVFDLSDDWSDLRTFAQFTQGENSYNSYLDSENSVFLPHEVVAGECYMMLYGTGRTDGEVIGTTNAIKMVITADRFVEDASSTVISESLYQQLIEQIRQYPSMEEIEDVLEDYITFDWIASLEEVKQALGIDD